MKKKIGYSLLILFVIVQLFNFNNVQIIKAAGTDIIVNSYSVTDKNTGKIVNQIYKGQSFKLTLNLENKTSSTINNVSVSIGEGSFYPEDTGSTKVISEILSTGSKTESTFFNLVYDGSSSSKIPITINYDGAASAINTYVGVNAIPPDASTTPLTPTDTSKYAPNLIVLDSSMPQGRAGDNITVPVTIKNTSSYSAKDIIISAELPDDSPFIMDSISRLQSVANLNSNTSTTVNFKFSIDSTAIEKVYAIKLSYKYNNYYGDSYGGTEHPVGQDTIYIKVTNFGATAKLSINKINVTPQVAKTGEKCQVELTIGNIGNQPLKDITLSLTGLKDDGFALAGGTNQQNFAYLQGNGEVTISYTLIPSSKFATGSYGLTLKMDYKNESGKDSSQEQQFFVPVQNGGGAGVCGTPKIILSKYSCNPLIVKAGENFKLNLSFLNTSKDKVVENIKVYFTVNETTTSGGNIFTPVNSSNTFFIDSIAPKSTVSKTLDFFTIPDASPKTYTVTANFEYEDADGKEYKASELIGIPVNQQVKLDTSEITIPQECYPGQPFPLMLDFYNTGKVLLSNMMIRVEGDFDAQNGRYFVGNFDKGSSDHYEATITPKTIGAVKGTLIMSYDDPTGQHMEIPKEFTLNVVEMPVQPAVDDKGNPINPEGSKPQSKASFIKKPIVFIPALVVIIVAATFLIIRKRKKKGGMTLDE